MRNHLQIILKDLNLNPKQIKCYLACLDLGKASVSEIAKQAHLDRTSCYQYLKTLANLGLVNIEFKKYSKKIISLPPQKILTLLENRQRKLKRRVLEFKELLPQVEKVFKVKPDKVKIRYFESLQGIKEIYQDTLQRPNSQILNFSSVDDVFKYIPQLITQYINTRVVKNIKVKVLIKKTDLAVRKLKPNTQKELREYKFLPANYKLTSEIMIYQNKIATISFRDKPFWGMIIEDKELSKNLKTVFKMLWNLLP